MATKFSNFKESLEDSTESVYGIIQKDMNYIIGLLSNNEKIYMCDIDESYNRSVYVQKLDIGNDNEPYMIYALMFDGGERHEDLMLGSISASYFIAQIASVLTDLYVSFYADYMYTK